MQPPGRVDDHDVGATRHGGIDRVERDSRRIAAGAGPDELRAGALGPQPQLIDRSSTKCVPRGNQHSLSLATQALTELSDECRLAGAVDADDEDDRRWRQ